MEVFRSNVYVQVLGTGTGPRHRVSRRERESEFFVENLLVRIHLIIVMIMWTGLAPWEFEFPFPGSLTSTFLVSRTPRECRLLST